MEKRKFLIKKIVFMMLLLVGLISKADVLQVQAATHTQTECVNWATSQLNKGLDYDGQYGNQCVDLIKYYYDYLGYANYATGNACAYAWNNLPPGWTRVYSNFQPGDIAVWKVNHSCSTCGTTEYGHVGIITSADSVGFNAVNQNFRETSHCTQNWFYCSALQCAIRPAFSSSNNTGNSSNTGTAIAWSATASDITYTNAKLSATVSTSTSVQFQWAGCNLFDNNGKLIAQMGEDTSVKGYYMNIWYNINTESWNHIQLSPGTTYQYQFYATYGGKDYFSPVYKFTTKQQTIHVTEVSLSQSSKTMKVGEKFQLNATVLPANATNKNVTWSVDNSSVVTVNEGYVTAQKAGVANITVKTADGSKIAKCSISVSNNQNYTPKTTTISKISPNSTGLKLYWKKISNASGYYIYRSVNGGSYSKYKTVQSNGTVSYQDKSVKNGNTYRYKIVTYRTVNGKVYRGGYSNTKKIYYLAKNSVKSLTNSSGKKMKVTWNKNSKVTGYEIQYAKYSDFSGGKNIKVKGASSTTKTISGLTKGKTYYVRVRTYRYVDGVTYYSCWSSSKKVKISK